MKITEPKTPYAKRYDPNEDYYEEEDVHMLSADDIVVDELDKVSSGRDRGRGTKDDEIPGLELGEPEEAVPEGRSSSSHKHEKQVVVDPEVDEKLAEGEDGYTNPDEEREKHRKFEEMRRKHYEMKEVKGLLGHPEELDALDDDDEEEDNNDDKDEDMGDDADDTDNLNGARVQSSSSAVLPSPPPIPRIPSQFDGQDGTTREET